MTATEAVLPGIGLKLVTKAQASRPSELVWYPFQVCWPRTYAHRPSLWDARIAKKPPTIDHAAIMRSDDGVKQWTSLIVSHDMRNTSLDDSRDTHSGNGDSALLTDAL